MKPLAIVIDDDPYWRDKICKCLEQYFDVECAATGEDGWRQLQDSVQSPALTLVILDDKLPPLDKLQGHDVLGKLKDHPVLQRVPVLMLTGFASAKFAFGRKADDYMDKDQFPDEEQFAEQFEARVVQLLARAGMWPFDSANESTLSLFLRSGAPVDVVVGVIDLHQQTNENLGLDLDRLKARGCNAYGGRWPQQAKDIGMDLYRSLVNHPAISVEIRNAIHSNRRMNLAGNMEMLDVPLEFLWDETAKDYFVLVYPFSRSVLDVHPARPYAPSISPKLLNDLHRQGSDLHVLLVASNTGGIPRVDKEVEQIARILEENPKGLRIKVDVLKTADATLKAVEEKLENGAYHIVHYAGHGEFVEHRTQDHRLLFRGKRDVSRPDSMPATRLKSLWRKKPPSLFYMSCCRGSATGSRRDLFNNDLLGLTDAAISAGVPSVIGFRWPVSDTGAQHLSTAFYEALLQTGRPDHALCTARSVVYRNHRDDPAWLSAVLVMQPP
jgi:DNA-binding NarL/FixJ family response regulator